MSVVVKWSTHHQGRTPNSQMGTPPTPLHCRVERECQDGRVGRVCEPDGSGVKVTLHTVRDSPTRAAASSGRGGRSACGCMLSSNVAGDSIELLVAPPSPFLSFRTRVCVRVLGEGKHQAAGEFDSTLTWANWSSQGVRVCVCVCVCVLWREDRRNGTSV